ncbi:hypothetical protein VP01_425g1 [Puccinia sorghi]|uniref:Uncharacterized protein n=1 Tax=Puccinia sorghi TaxID=27349 RepID=A0A0L6UQD5_9BASI|nr:hypothetical protein VP01_425g1 [Puccinia sorghi]
MINLIDIFWGLFEYNSASSIVQIEFYARNVPLGFQTPSNEISQNLTYYTHHITLKNAAQYFFISYKRLQEICGFHFFVMRKGKENNREPFLENKNLKVRPRADHLSPQFQHRGTRASDSKKKIFLTFWLTPNPHPKRVWRTVDTPERGFNLRRGHHTMVWMSSEEHPHLVRPKVVLEGPQHFLQPIWHGSNKLHVMIFLCSFVHSPKTMKQHKIHVRYEVIINFIKSKMMVLSFDSSHILEEANVLTFLSMSNILFILNEYKRKRKGKHEKQARKEGKEEKSNENCILRSSYKPQFNCNTILVQPIIGGSGFDPLIAFNITKKKFSLFSAAVYPSSSLSCSSEVVYFKPPLHFPAVSTTGGSSPASETFSPPSRLPFSPAANCPPPATHLPPTAAAPLPLLASPTPTFLKATACPPLLA